MEAFVALSARLAKSWNPISTRMESTIRKAVLFLMLAGLTSLHAGSTKIISSWFAPDAKGVKLGKFLAIVVTRSVGTRRAGEDEMVSLLNNRSNDAQAPMAPSSSDCTLSTVPIRISLRSGPATPPSRPETALIRYPRNSPSLPHTRVLANSVTPI